MLDTVIQNAGLHIQFANTIKAFEADDWLSTLIGAEEFGVGMEFIDPRTGKYLSNVFRFFPAVQNHLGSFSYLAEHNGTILRIPADTHWWERHFEEGSNSLYQQRTTIVHEGQLRIITFDSSIKKVHINDFLDL